MRLVKDSRENYNSWLVSTYDSSNTALRACIMTDYTKINAKSLCVTVNKHKYISSFTSRVKALLNSPQGRCSTGSDGEKIMVNPP